MAFILDAQSTTIAGLGTSQYVVPSAGPYAFSIRTSVVPPSSLVISIRKNGVTLQNSVAMVGNQGHLEIGQFYTTCVANDTISFILSSAALADNLPNSVKSLICVFNT